MLIYSLNKIYILSLFLSFQHVRPTWSIEQTHLCFWCQLKILLVVPYMNSSNLSAVLYEIGLILAQNLKKQRNIFLLITLYPYEMYRTCSELVLYGIDVFLCCLFFFLSFFLLMLLVYSFLVFLVSSSLSVQKLVEE